MHKFKTSLVVAILVALGAITWGAASVHAQDSQTQASERTWSCSGVIQFPRQHPLGAPFTLTLTSHMRGGIKIDREYAVGADGHFAVTLEQGAGGGVLRGRSEFCGIEPAHLALNGLRRFQLQARAWSRNSFVVKDALGEELQGLEVGWFGSLDGEGDDEMHILAVDESGGFCVTRPDSECWVFAKAKGRAMYAQRLAQSEYPGEQPEVIVLQPLARISGRVTSAQGFLQKQVDIECEFPFRPVGTSEFTRKAPLKDGRFDLWVPANTANLLHIFGDGTHVRFEVPSLEPGQHLTGQVVEFEFHNYLLGRVVDPDGKPIQGAYVRGLNQSDPAGWMGVRSPLGSYATACTDADGRFVFLGLDDLPPALAEWGHPAFVNVSVAIPREDGSVARQHFMTLSAHKEGNTLVFSPGSESIGGMVLGPDELPLDSFSVHIYPLELPPEGRAYSSNCSFGSPLHFLTSSPSESIEADPVAASLFSPRYPLTYTYSFEGTSGLFNIEHLPTGKWGLRIESEGLVQTTIEEFELPCEDSIKVLMQPVGELLVTYLSSSGRPLVDREIMLKWPLPRPSGTGQKFDLRRLTTDAQGQIHWQVKVAGSYELYSYSSDWPRLTLQLDLGKRTEKTVRTPERGSIHGVLDWPNAPGRVRIRLSDPLRPGYIWGIQSHFGEFRQAHVPPGVYELELTGAGITEEIKERLDLTPIEVVGGQEVELLIQLKPESEHPR